jgi:hypothetical protein
MQNADCGLRPSLWLGERAIPPSGAEPPLGRSPGWNPARRECGMSSIEVQRARFEVQRGNWRTKVRFECGIRIAECGMDEPCKVQSPRYKVPYKCGLRNGEFGIDERFKVRGGGSELIPYIRPFVRSYSLREGFGIACRGVRWYEGTDCMGCEVRRSRSKVSFEYGGNKLRSGVRCSGLT